MSDIVTREKVGGPFESRLRFRLAGLEQSISASLGLFKAADVLSHDDELAAKILRTTYPALIGKFAEIERFRDWQYAVWRGSTARNIDKMEADAQRLELWVDLIEWSLDQARDLRARKTA
ncbi:MAG TPA: hypothetical protein VF463_10690 [Sphingobium sp.]